MSEYCSLQESREFRYLQSLSQVQQGKKSLDEALMELAQLESSSVLTTSQLEYEHQRLARMLEKLLQGLSPDQIAQQLLQDGFLNQLRERADQQKIQQTKSHLQQILREYQRQGYIDLDGMRLRITPKGARILGMGLLRRILENLSRKGVGIHEIQKQGMSPFPSTNLRRYQLGDPYEWIDIERSLLNVMERGASLDDISSQDLVVRIPKHQSRLAVGIILDESGSMIFDNKIEAAIQAGLALAELMRTRFPEDILKLYAFSESCRELRPWELLDIKLSGFLTDLMRYTNIKEPLVRFRRETSGFQSERQVFLITDSEPNWEDGRYVGFLTASKGVLREALIYRSQGITLNLIMLDRDPYLRRFAEHIAKLNLGRVIFADPQELGEIIIQDYLARKSQRISSGAS